MCPCLPPTWKGKTENRFRLKKAKPVLCIAEIPFWISGGKRNGRELHLIAGENLYDWPFEAAIRVGNRYEER